MTDLVEYYYNRVADDYRADTDDDESDGEDGAYSPISSPTEEVEWGRKEEALKERNIRCAFLAAFLSIVVSFYDL
jgi:hypothetical protein